MLKEVVKTFIEEKSLFTKTDRLLVGVSGGADSVALLRVLLELGYTCEVAHCNFHLRGEESNRDEAFVRDLCQKLNIIAHFTSFQTEEYASNHHISIEMAARQLRYDYFERISLMLNAKYVCVAHHREDSVETFLLNLMRGTGIQGLRGIQPQSANVCRPLLCVTKDEILAYLQSLGQDYVTDSTNLETDALRNKVRLELLPLMEQINPAASEHIWATSQRLDEAYTLYSQSIEEGRRRVLTPQGISIQALKQEPAPATLLHEILSPMGFNSAQEADIMKALDGQSGKLFQTATNLLVKDREMLLIYNLEEPQPPKLYSHKEKVNANFEMSTDKKTACLDASKVTQPLSLRPVQPGDAFIPLGMKGRKLVSDYMTDNKFSLIQKRNQWVLCCGDNIVWLVGERIDHRYRITPETEEVLIVSWVEE